MNPIVYRTGLFFLIAAAVTLVGCEESLTDSTTEGIPDTGGDNQPFITIVSGSQSSPLVGTAERFPIELFGSDPTNEVDLEVEPNFTVRNTIEFEYSVSGSATQGTDFTVDTPNPAAIEFDTSSTSIDNEFITIAGGGTQQVPLTTEFRTVDVTLESASTVNGTRDVLVGRGGSDVGTTRSVEIAPSIFLLSSGFATLDGVSLAETTVGESNSTTVILLNSSLAPFEATNVSIEGTDSDQFSVNSLISNPVEPGELPKDGAPSPALQVAFSPDSEGEKNAELTIDVSNASNSNTLTYPVTGTAVAAE